MDQKKLGIPLTLALVFFLQSTGALGLSIESVDHYPDPVLIGNNLTIEADINETSEENVSAWVNFTNPGGVGNSLEMQETSGELYRFVYQPPAETNYTYKVQANDTNGSSVQSGKYEFQAVGYEADDEDDVPVQVEIAPSCKVSFDYAYPEQGEKIVRDQNIFFLLIKRNTGNIALNESSRMYTEDPYGVKVHEHKQDIRSPLPVREDDSHWSLWRVGEEAPLGTYFFHGISDFTSDSKRPENYTYSWPDYNETEDVMCRNVTDDTNETKDENYLECEKVFETDYIYTYGAKYNTSLYRTTNETVENQTENTTGYYSTINISKERHHAYTFDVEDCEGYCYACLSEEKGITNEEEQCTYEGSMSEWIDLGDKGNFTVHNLDSNGTEVEFKDTVRGMVNMSIFSECTLIDNDTIVCDEYIRCHGKSKMIRNFEVVTGIGKLKPEPPEVAIIREMPQYIEENENCSENSTWENCKSITVKLVAFNKEEDEVSLRRVVDSYEKECQNCDVLDYRCIEGKGYQCNIDPNINETNQTDRKTHVEFLSNQTLAKHDYQIFNYEVIVSSSSYSNEVTGDAPNIDFKANATYNYTQNMNVSNTVTEDDEELNPYISRKLLFIGEPVFNYFLDSNAANTTQDRHLFKGEPAKMKLTARNLGERPGNWSYQVEIPEEWNINSVSKTSGPADGCNYLPDESMIKCSGTQSLSTGDEIVTEFNVSTTTISEFILPLSAKNDVEEEFVPGLFTIVKKYEEKPEPEPEPQPEPEPEPEPQPQPKPEPEPGPIKINIEPIQDKFKGRQEKLTPVGFTVENVGNRVAENITIKPLPGEDWRAEEAYVDSIEPNETLNRTTFLQPSWEVPPATYAIPTRALSKDNESLDLTYFRFEVLPGEDLASVRIVESPQEVSLDSNSEETIPILVRNIGVKPLTGVEARIQNVENCFKDQSSGVLELDKDEDKSLPISVETVTGPETCRGTIIVSSDQEAYALARIQVNIRTPSALIPRKLPIAPTATVIFMIMAFILINIRKRSKKLNILFYITVSVLAISVIYLLLGYMGYVPLIT